MSCPFLTHFIRKTHKISNSFLLATSLTPSGRHHSEVQRSCSLGESHFTSYIIRVVTLAYPAVKKALLEVEPSHLHYELLSGGANMGKATWEEQVPKFKFWFSINPVLYNFWKSRGFEQGMRKPWNNPLSTLHGRALEIYPLFRCWWGEKLFLAMHFVNLCLKSWIFCFSLHVLELGRKAQLTNMIYKKSVLEGWKSQVFI